MSFPKLSFPKSLVIWSSATKVTHFGRWLEKDLGRIEKRFAAFITISSARKATQATIANICESR